VLGLLCTGLGTRAWAPGWDDPRAFVLLVTQPRVFMLSSNICNDGGTFCVQRDNEGFYGRPMDEASALAGIGMACFRCDSRLYHC